MVLKIFCVISPSPPTHSRILHIHTSSYKSVKHSLFVRQTFNQFIKCHMHCLGSMWECYEIPYRLSIEVGVRKSVAWRARPRGDDLSCWGLAGCSWLRVPPHRNRTRFSTKASHISPLNKQIQPISLSDSFTFILLPFVGKRRPRFLCSFDIKEKWYVFPLRIYSMYITTCQSYFSFSRRWCEWDSMIRYWHENNKNFFFFLSFHRTPQPDSPISSWWEHFPSCKN